MDSDEAARDRRRVVGSRTSRTQGVECGGFLCRARSARRSRRRRDARLAGLRVGGGAVFRMGLDPKF